MTADFIIDSEWHSLDFQTENQHATIDLLSDAPLFESLSLRELHTLERLVHLRHFHVGETILRAGQPRSGMYIIQSGSARVVRPQSDGTTQQIGHLDTGALIGEFSLLDSTARSSAIQAAEHSTLIGFFRPDLMGLIQTDPKIGFKILYRLSQMMADQFRRDMQQLRALQKQRRKHNGST